MVTAAHPMRVVFFGTPDFAVPTLQALYQSRHSVVAVVTQPDRARDRGHRAQPGSVKRCALEHNQTDILQPDRLRDDDFLATLRALGSDLGVVAAYGKILTEAVLGIPTRGLVNVHASLLPKYRGAAPVHRAVMAGEAETGVTIMRVVKALDAGPVMAKVVRAIGPGETSSDVERDLSTLGAQLLIETIDAMADGRAREVSQDESLATYASKIEKADGLINWRRSAVDLHNQIRGLHPWPHAFTDLDAERMILLKSDVEPGTPPVPGVPGTVLEAHGDVLRVLTGDGVLRLHILQREGRRAVSAREFLAGRPIQPGARLGVAHATS